MGKGSKRRQCQISREEESLRWDLALGKITLAEFYGGVCGNCLDGMLADPEGNYKVTCRHDNTTHHQWDTCERFREENLHCGSCGTRLTVSKGEKLCAVCRGGR